jgi:hypothetical protein
MRTFALITLPPESWGWRRSWPRLQGLRKAEIFFRGFPLV